MTQISFEEAGARAADLIERSRSIVILCHREPDADTVGSGLALAAALRSRGHDVAVASADPFPANLDNLTGFAQSGAATLPATADLVISVDSSSEARLGSLRSWIDRGIPVLAIDHHVSATGFGTINLVDDRAPATAAVVTGLLDRMGIPITPEIATCLYAGLFRDTAGLRSATTTADTLTLAARLANAGADPAAIADRIFGRSSLRQLAVVAHAVATMRVEDDGHLVWSSVNAQESQGASESEAEAAVDELTQAGGDMTLLFHEIGARSVEVHVRTRQPLDAAELAVALGGGGHRLRAGARVALPLEAARDHVLTLARQQLDRDLA